MVELEEITVPADFPTDEDIRDLMKAERDFPLRDDVDPNHPLRVSLRAALDELESNAELREAFLEAGRVIRGAEDGAH